MERSKVRGLAHRGDVPLSAKKVIRHQAIAALPTLTYLELVPAPGPNKLLLFESLVAVSRIVVGYDGRDADMQMYVAWGDDDAGVASGPASTEGLNGHEPVDGGTASTGEFGNLLFSSHIMILPPRYRAISVVSVGTFVRPQQNVLLDAINAPLKLVVYNNADFTAGDERNTITFVTNYRELDVSPA